MIKRKRLLFSLLFLIVIVPTAIYFAQHPLFASADSHVSFDEGGGTSVKDTEGTLTGTITGATWVSDGCKDGKCLSFDGTGDYVSFGDAASLDYVASDNWTQELWFRHGPISSGTQVLIAKHNATAGGYKVYLNSDGTISFGIDDDSTWNPDDVATSTSRYDDSRWHMISIVKTGTTRIDLYIDAIAVASDTSISATGTLVNSDTYYLSMDGNGSSNGWVGFLDDFKVYASARTADQIKADFIAGSPLGGNTASFGTDTASNLTNGLVGWWKMDETSWINDCFTSSIIDSSGTNNNGKACPNSTGPTGAALGKFGVGGNFNGTNQYISIGNPSSLNFNDSSFTINTWFQIDTLPSTGSNHYTLINKENASGTSTARGFSLFVNKYDDKLNFRSYNSSGWPDGATTLVSINALSTATWYQVTATYDSSSKTVKLFLNGVEQADSTVSEITNASGQNVTFASYSSGASGFTDGNLDEVRIYNRALSPAEVQQLYTYAPGPVGWWKLDENTNTSILDSSGNNNSGTIHGTPNWTIGKTGSAMNFNSGDDYVSAEDSNSLDINYGITISAWIKRDSASFGNWNTILDKYETSGGNDWEYWLGFSSSNALDFMYNPGTKDDSDRIYSTNSSAAITDSNWHYVTATYDKSNVILYIDGVKKYSIAHADTIYSGTGLVKIGIGASADSTTRFYGNIDDVKIYNYARTPAQILEDMNGGKPANTSPIAYYKFDEGFGDYNYNSGTQTAKVWLAGGNTCPGDSTCPTWTNDGKFSKALSFDGGDFAESEVSSSLDFYDSMPITTSIWIKTNTKPTNNYGLIMINDNSVGDYAQDKSIQITSAGLARYYTYDGSEVYATGTTDVTDGNWHHLVGTFDGTTQKIYVDGILEGQTAATTTQNFVQPKLILSNYVVGYYDRYIGLIDEAKIFNFALTPDQVVQEYNQGQAQVLGSLSDTSSLTGGSVASNSASVANCVPGSSDPCNPPLHYWKLDENTGTTANDIGYSPASGTLYNNSQWKPGKNGSAVSFKSSNFSLINTGNASINNKSALTLSAWIKRSVTGDDTLIGEENYGSRTGFSIEWYSDNKFYCNIYDGTYYHNAVFTPPNDFNWHYFSCVFDGSQLTDQTKAKIYMDGVLQTTTNENESGNLPTTVHADDTDFYIAKGYSNATIDDVKVYDYARTPAQVAWDYNHGSPMAWWKLDEPSWNTTASEVKDSSGNNYHGTAGNNATTTTGKYNQAGTFDGSGDYVSFGSSTSFITGSSETSVCAWIKYAPSSVTTDGAIISKYDGSLQGWMFWVDDSAAVSGRSNTITFMISPDSDPGRVEGSSNLVETDVWSHYCGVFKGGSYLRLYKNGILDQQVTVSVPTTVDSTTNATYLGRVDSGTTRDFEGQIDDVRIYNYALTQTQIQTIMNNGAVRF